MYIDTYIVFQIVMLMKSTRSKYICSNAMIKTDNAMICNNRRSQVHKKSAVCLGCQPGTETFIFTQKSQFTSSGEEIPHDRQVYLLHDTVFGTLGLPSPPVKEIPPGIEPLKTTVCLLKTCLQENFISGLALLGMQSNTFPFDIPLHT